MTKNYPSSWTSSAPTFFSKTAHPGWYATGEDNKIGMPYRAYITNLGHMYARNGVVLMFGGNGTIFDDPDSLSIGMFRVKFGEQNNVTGIPYAYLLSGMY